MAVLEAALVLALEDVDISVFLNVVLVAVQRTNKALAMLRQCQMEIEREIGGAP